MEAKPQAAGYEKVMSERPEEREKTTSVETATPSGAGVPAATGSTTTYTTGTLQPGEVGPAVTKPEGEGPTPGEGPIDEVIQAEDTEEFREARQNRDQ